jgi:hypothetical protein
MDIKDFSFNKCGIIYLVRGTDQEQGPVFAPGSPLGRVPKKCKKWRK